MTTNSGLWVEHDVEVSPTSPLTRIITVSTALVATMAGTLGMIHRITQSTAFHLIQGVPILLTLFGAAMVALGLVVKQWEPLCEIRLKQRETDYQEAKNDRPTLPANDLTSEQLETWQEHLHNERTLATALISTKKRAARWASAASGLEIAGAHTLLIGAVLGFASWALA